MKRLVDVDGTHELRIREAMPNPRSNLSAVRMLVETSTSPDFVGEEVVWACSNTTPGGLATLKSFFCAALKTTRLPSVPSSIWRLVVGRTVSATVGERAAKSGGLIRFVTFRPTAGEAVPSNVEVSPEEIENPPAVALPGVPAIGRLTASRVTLREWRDTTQALGRTVRVPPVATADVAPPSELKSVAPLTQLFGLGRNLEGLRQQVLAADVTEEEPPRSPYARELDLDDADDNEDT